MSDSEGIEVKSSEVRHALSLSKIRYLGCKTR